MMTCPPDGIELPPIDEMDCFEIERPKKKYKGVAKYLGVKGTTEDGNYIHHFDFNDGSLLVFVAPTEEVKELTKGQEIETEFEI